MKKVSIIIITYNRPERLKIAINSALEQTYNNCEIIVVDDNSDYDISKILNIYNEKITIIKNKENLGPSGSRNVGIKKSNGDYITFLDDDDIFHPKKIEKQINLFNKSENIGLVYCPVAEIYNNKLFYKPLINKKNKWVRLIHQNYIGITPLIKIECLSNCGFFDTNLKYHEDRDLWYRIGKKYSFGFINDSYYICYSIIKNRLSAQIENICNHKKLLYEKYKDDFENKDIYYSDLYKEIAFTYLFFGYYKRFFEHLKKSIDKKQDISSIIKDLYIKWLFELIFNHTNIIYKKEKIEKDIKKLLKQGLIRGKINP